MRGRGALAVSLAAHGAIAAAGLALLDDRPGLAARRPLESAAAMEITVVVAAAGATVAAPADPATPAAQPGPRPPTRRRASPAPRGGSGGGGTAAPVTAGPSLLGMRRVPTVVAAPSAVPVGDIAPGVAVVPAKPSGQLAPAPGGAAVIRDLVATIDVDPDGHVRVRDKPVAQAKIIVVTPAKLGRAILEWYKDPLAQTRVGRPQDLPAHEQPTKGPERIAQDYPSTSGSAGGAIAQIAATLFIPKLTGSLDLGDLGMRAHGIDPYLARKRKAIDATFDERVARGREHHREELARTPELVRKQLAKIWALPLTADERRAAVRALWDDCDESDSPDGQACALAHATLTGWLAAHPLD